MSSTQSDEVLSNIGYIIHKFISEVLRTNWFIHFIHLHIPLQCMTIRFMCVLFLQINKNIERLHLSLGLHQQDDGLFGSGKICDPFSAADYTYVPEKCTKNDIQIGELPNVSKRFHELIIYDSKGSLLLAENSTVGSFRIHLLR